MSQGKASSFSSKLQNGGRALLYSHPISGSQTFKPSGHPNDPPERARETDDEYVSRRLGVDTPEGRDALDAKLVEGHPAYVQRILRENAYYERLRFKSPRARRRELIR